MKTTAKILHVAATLALVAGSAMAAETSGNTTMDIVRDSLRADKKAFVAANMSLSDEKGKTFWPVYDRYQSELMDVQGQLFEVIAEYQATVDTLTDEQAKALIERYLKAEEDRAKLRRKYADELGKLLTGKELARFYQIENKIDAVVRFEAAAAIPLVATK